VSAYGDSDVDTAFIYVSIENINAWLRLMSQAQRIRKKYEEFDAIVFVGAANFFAAPEDWADHIGFHNIEHLRKFGWALDPAGFAPTDYELLDTELGRVHILGAQLVWYADIHHSYTCLSTGGVRREALLKIKRELSR